MPFGPKARCFFTSSQYLNVESSSSTYSMKRKYLKALNPPKVPSYHAPSQLIPQSCLIYRNTKLPPPFHDMMQCNSEPANQRGPIHVKPTIPAI